MRVKNAHVIGIHEISPGTRWVQETLGEWVAEGSWPGSQEGRNSPPVSTWEASQLRTVVMVGCWSGERYEQGSRDPNSTKDQERKACGSRAPLGNQGCLEEPQRDLGISCAVTCPEVKVLLVRW